MLDFDAPLADREWILFRKAKVCGQNKWLYSFRDAEKAAEEEQAGLRTHAASTRRGCRTTVR